MIVPSLKQAGPVNVAYDLVSLLIKNGLSCEVLYFDEIKDNTHCFPCPVKRISMSERIDFNQYDVVHTHGLRPVRYIDRYRKQNSRTKFVTTIHNYVFSDFRFKYGMIKAIIGGLMFIKGCRKHDIIVTLSNDAQKYYTKFIPKDKVSYIYNSRVIDRDAELEVAEKEEIGAFKSDSILIGTNSSLIKRKGLDVLIKAMALLPKRYKLFICGDGSEKIALRLLAEECGISERVYFAGFRDNSYRYIPFYDIFVLPSRSEGFPLGLVEAAAFGKKVVCSDLPMLTEAFSREEVSFFKMDDVSDLAKSIENISNNDLKGRNLYLKYEKSLAPEIMLGKYLNVYKK